MGLLRLYLAVCVVGAHSGAVFAWGNHDGTRAVQIFFMISGFYMQMICGSKYESICRFYISRLYRVIVPYWFALMLVLAASFVFYWRVGQFPFNLYFWFNQPLEKNGAEGIVFTGVANLTVFFKTGCCF
jgi:peptidoglycan/LPS O-acetylase OafA/YrhL